MFRELANELLCICASLLGGDIEFGAHLLVDDAGEQGLTVGGFPDDRAVGLREKSVESRVDMIIVSSPSRREAMVVALATYLSVNGIRLSNQFPDALVGEERELIDGHGSHEGAARVEDLAD